MARDSVPSTRQPVVDGRGIITEPWLRFFKFLYDTTGESSETYITDNSTSTIESSQNNLANMLTYAQLQNVRVSPLPVDYNRFYSKALSGGKNHVAAFDFIEATNSAEILLPEYPNDNDVIIVANGDGSSITVNPRGKLINSANKYIIRRKETTLVFHFFGALNKWRIR